MAAPAKKETLSFGVSFPKDASGKRSTSKPGQEIIAKAIEATKSGDAEKDKLKTEAAGKVTKEKNWRFGYLKHFEKMIRFSCESNKKAVDAATAGIAEARKQFMFVEKDLSDPKKEGKEQSFEEYTKRTDFKPFGTLELKGEGKGEAPHFFVYDNKDCKPENVGSLKKHEKDGLKKLMTKWAEEGVVEPDVAKSILHLIGDGQQGLDLKGKCFVLFGAGSFMGPFNMLMDHGATVVALDVYPSTFPAAKDLWKRMVDKCKSSRGTLLCPVDPTKKYVGFDGAKDAINEFDPTDTEKKFSKSRNIGCNITEDTGRIVAWLKDILPGQELVLGNYTYLDGDNFVKLSVAIDWIMEETIKNRPKKTVSLSLLCTPTDLHIVPKESVDAAKKNYSFSFSPKRLMFAILNMLTLGKWLHLNFMKPAATDDGKEIYLCCSAATEQGPNYLTAKRMQTWRYMVEYDKKNVKAVSINIAPSTATPSVYSNKFIKWSMEGWSFFRPLVRFFPFTSQSLMGGLMISDIINPDSAANPDKRSAYGIDNVVSIVAHNSAHGGMWRSGYNIDSLGKPSAIMYLLGGGQIFGGKVAGYVFMLEFFSIIALIFWKLSPILEPFLSAQFNKVKASGL